MVRPKRLVSNGMRYDFNFIPSFRGDLVGQVIEEMDVKNKRRIRELVDEGLLSFFSPGNYGFRIPMFPNDAVLRLDDRALYFTTPNPANLFLAMLARRSRSAAAIQIQEFGEYIPPEQMTPADWKVTRIKYRTYWGTKQQHNLLNGLVERKVLVPEVEGGFRAYSQIDKRRLNLGHPLFPSRELAEVYKESFGRWMNKVRIDPVNPL